MQHTTFIYPIQDTGTTTTSPPLCAEAAESSGQGTSTKEMCLQALQQD